LQYQNNKTMSLITPQVHFKEDGRRDTSINFYKTYHKHLKPAIPQLFKDFNIDEISVYRSKRGEWGEWFEVWKQDGRGGAVIIKEGWS